jgi:hypothetical protein
LDDAANGERLSQSVAAAGDNRAAKNLDSLFLTFQNALMNVHLIADGKGWQFFFAIGFFD